MKKQPEVTAQTRKKLMDAFWKIYQEKGINQITVGAITRAAEFNRGTFYEYFTDIYDLLGQLEDNLLEDLKIQAEQRFKGGLPKNFQDFSNTCAHIFSLYGDKLYILLSSKGDPVFSVKLQKELRSVFLSVVGFSEEQPHLDYLITFGFSAMIGLVGHWYEKGKEMEIEELFQLMQSLVAAGITGYTKKKLFEQT